MLELIPGKNYYLLNKAKKLEAESAVWDRTECPKAVATRISERFDILEYLVNESIEGKVRALIVSGPAGLGKSYTVESALEVADPDEQRHAYIKGFVKPTGLFKLLHQFRHEGNVIVFDDADAIFNDESSLNMLKAVCDTTERRKVSYMSEHVLIDEETDERIPKTFQFDGTIIFVTNYDFDQMIEKDHKLTPHLKALISRAHYVDLKLKTKQDYLIRIRDVIEHGLLDHKCRDDYEAQDVVQFIEEHADTLRELSLRTAIKLADIRRGDTPNWAAIARITTCRMT